MTVPEIAENGAVVPVTVASTLANVEQISVFVDKNPNVMAANFVFPAGTEGLVTTRVKMGQTASVVAVVKADGKYLPHVEGSQGNGRRLRRLTLCGHIKSIRSKE